MQVSAGWRRLVQDAADRCRMLQFWSQLVQIAARRFRLVQDGADKYEMLLLHR